MAQGAQGYAGKKLIEATAALYWRPPNAQELAGTKYRLSDYKEPVVEVWEEHWDVLMLFKRYSGQWRIGPRGPVSLDYNVIHHALDRKGITGEQFDQYLDDLAVIERNALAKMLED